MNTYIESVSCEHLWETLRTESYPLIRDGRYEPQKTATKVTKVFCKKCLMEKDLI